MSYLWGVHSAVTKMLTDNYCGYVECRGQRGQQGTMRIVWGAEEDSQRQWCLGWMRGANRTLLSQTVLSCRFVWAGQCLPHSRGFKIITKYLILDDMFLIHRYSLFFPLHLNITINLLKSIQCPIDAKSVISFSMHIGFHLVLIFLNLENICSLLLTA